MKIHAAHAVSLSTFLAGASLSWLAPLARPAIARFAALCLPLLLLSPLGKSADLLVNPGAETGDLTGWIDPLGNGFNIGSTTVPSAHPPQQGSFCFWAGLTGPIGIYANELRQDVDVSNLAAFIDAGQASSCFTGWARTAGTLTATDPAWIRVEYLDAGGGILAVFDSSTVLPINTWVLVTEARVLPALTRTLRVRLLGTRTVGSSTDALFDNLSLSVSTPGSAASYCTAGTSASGCQAVLSVAGAASATASAGFVVTASSVEGSKDGLFFFGVNGRQANPWGSGSSFQCVVPPVKRAGLLVGTGTVGACDGAFTQDLNALWCSGCPKPFHNPGVGAIVQAQCWYRDPQNTSNQTTSLSNAIEFCVGN